MAFIRVKKLKGNSYYYLVKCIRINGKPRQKVVKYLGKSANLTKLLQNVSK